MKLSKKDNKPAVAGAPKKGTISFGKKKSVIDETNPETFVYQPQLPQVNVIPAKVTEKYEVKGVARKTAAIVGGVAGAFVLVFVAGQAYIGGLNGQYDELLAERAVLQTESAQLQPYQTYQLAVGEKRNALAAQVENDVNMGSIYGDLYGTGNANDITLTNISIQQQDNNGLEEGGCTNPDPFVEASNVVGCITMQGTSSNPEASKGFVESLVALATPARYASPFITSIGTADGQTNFDASISFTREVYTHQYDALKLTIEELIALQSTSGEGEEVVEETPAQTQEPLAPPVEEEEESTSGLVSAQALALVPELDENNLSDIDAVTTDVCSSKDVDSAITDGISQIRAIIESASPEIEDLDGIVATLQATLLEECDGGK